MATDREYLEFVLEQLSDAEDIAYRQMFGEYVIYYRGKVIGGIYDNRFLVKPVKGALELMPDAPMECPYEGAKDMLTVTEIENRELMKDLMDILYEELPAPKNKKGKRK